MNTADDFLFGSGARSVSWRDAAPGKEVRGRIARTPEVRQQTEYRTNKPLTWDDGRPRMQLIVVLETAERDPLTVDDDGMRALYIKGKSLTTAVREAVRATGRRSLEVGGELAVRFEGYGTPARPGDDPPRIFTARYSAPASAADRALGLAPASDPAPSGIDQRVWDGLDAEGRARARALLRETSSRSSVTPSDDPPF